MSPDHITAGAYNRDIDKRLARIWSGYARLVTHEVRFRFYTVTMSQKDGDIRVEPG